MSDEMIERVGDAIASAILAGTKSDNYYLKNGGLDIFALGRAAIEAMREPTKKMVNSVEFSPEAAFGGADAKYCWQCMIDAALK